MAPDAEPMAAQAVGADPMAPIIARVTRQSCDAPEVFTLELEPQAGTALTPFVPGQFNMLTVFGVGEVPISFSGDARIQDRLTHTIRAVGPVSKALTELRPGAAVGLRGPFGVGWPMAEADGKDVVVVTGGLGLAPLRPALYHLFAERERFGKIVLLYGTRSPEDILFRAELESWSARLDAEVEVTVDHAERSWRGHVGVVTKLIPRCDFDPANTIALVCGPEIMMRFAIAALEEAGVKAGDIYLSMERNMKCAVGFCGHCQFGPVFVCRDGPVFPYDRLRDLLALKEF